MSDAISPEERLFSVIQQSKRNQERSGKTEPKNPGAVPRRASQGNGSGFKASDFLKRIASLEKRALSFKARWEIKPETINKFLIVALTVVLGFVIFAAAKKTKDVNLISEAVSKIRSFPGTGRKPEEPLKDLSYYLNEIKRRDIFHANAPAPVFQGLPKTSPQFAKATEDLKLQGISWADIPKAMILWENGKESRMFFLVEGQPIGTTGFKVVKINRNRVIIGNGSEETVLS